MKIVEKRRTWFFISIAIIVVGLIMAFVNGGLNLDIEFTGGTMMHVEFNDQAVEDADISAIIDETLGAKAAGADVQAIKNENQVIIKTKELTTDERVKLMEGLANKYGIDPVNDLLSHSNISGTISTELQRDAILAVLVAALIMLIYISIRFHDITTGVSAIAALLHDVLVVLAIYAIFRIPVNNSFIAAMLTIVGYSINDTIVVFDRIRENQKTMRRGHYADLVDRSINQTLARSINTSLTTVVMVALLYFLGVPAIRDFAFPLMMGILSGTYSSIFIASPIWFLFKKGKDTSKAAI